MKKKEKIKPIQAKEVIEIEEAPKIEEAIEKAVEEEIPVPKRRWEEKEEPEWIPRTKLGKDVKAGKIKDIDEIFDKGIPILEAGITTTLIPDLQMELINIGQSKGKFGGGKKRIWRQTQKKTAEENVPSFACMVVVGDGRGHVGLGYGKSSETLPAKEKSIRNARINITRIKRGCGSFDCVCKEGHSVPFKVEGKCGSARIILSPAPRGTGLAIEDECKKVLKLAGIKDIYSKTFGQTRTKFNLIKACFKALEKTTQ